MKESTEGRKSGQVSSELEQLQCSIGELEELFAKHVQLIKPILRDPQPQTGEDKACDPALVEVAMRIRGNKMRIKCICEALKVLSSLVEL